MNYLAHLFLGGNTSASGGFAQLTVSAGASLTVTNNVKVWNTASHLSIQGGTATVGAPYRYDSARCARKGGRAGAHGAGLAYAGGPACQDGVPHLDAGGNHPSGG